jgi:preprotein translocase subunit YajC
MILLLQGAGGGISTMLFFAGMMLIMYLFMIRPQMNRQKEAQKFTESVEKGKTVITTGGLVGKISKIDGQFITLQVDAKTFIKVTRGSLSKELTESLANDVTVDA